MGELRRVRASVSFKNTILYRYGSVPHRDQESSLESVADLSDGSRPTKRSVKENTKKKRDNEGDEEKEE